MSPGLGFLAFFALTLVLLAVVAWSGLTARRKVHRKLAFIVLAMTVLCAITGTIMILRAQRFPA